MAAVLERDITRSVRPGVDEAPARAELRRQIELLESRLAAIAAEAFPRVRVDTGVAARCRTPRLLDLGSLESLRDDLAEGVAAAAELLRERSELEDANRALLRRMRESPADYKWVRISRADLGEPGCGHWHSKPRLGPIGMLMGWWRVKVSSGCPLPGRLAAVER